MHQPQQVPNDTVANSRENMTGNYGFGIIVSVSVSVSVGVGVSAGVRVSKETTSHILYGRGEETMGYARKYNGWG